MRPRNGPIGAAVVGTLLIAAGAMADDRENGFFIVPFDPPGDIAEVDEVRSINDSGAFTLVGSDATGATRSFVHVDTEWIEIPRETFDHLHITQINDAGQISGYRWDDGQPEYAFRYDLENDVFHGLGQGRALGVSNQNDIVGWRDSLGPVAVIGGTLLRDLPGYSGGTASAAVAINQRGEPGQASPPPGFIVGRSSDSLGDLHAVIWIDDGVNQSVSLLSSDSGNVEYHPTAVNDNGVVVGVEVDVASDPMLTTYNPVYWVVLPGPPVTVTGPFDLPTVDPGSAAWPDEVHGINNANACVGGGRVWKANDAGANRYAEIDIHGYRARPMVETDSDWEVFAISDRGVMVGMADLTGSSVGGPQPIVVLAVDHDDNAVADHQDFFDAVPPTGEPNEWDVWGVFPLQRLAGYHAPGTTPAAASTLGPYGNYIRRMSNQFEVALIVSNQAACSDFRDGLNLWGHSAKCKIVLSMRTSLKDGWIADAGPDFDYIPGETKVYGTSEVTRPEILANLTELASRFGSYIDFLQIGNEMYSGIGQYYFDAYEVPNSSVILQGSLRRDVLGDHLDEAKLVIDAWVEDQRLAFLRGLTAYGFGPRIIGPGVPAETLTSAAQGNPFGDKRTADEGGGQAEANNRAAYAVDWMASWTRKSGGSLDIHYHYQDYTTDVDNVRNITGSPYWSFSPTQNFVALEIGPMPSKTWWKDFGEADTRFYFDPSIPCVDPPAPDYRAFLDQWIADDNQITFSGETPDHEAGIAEYILHTLLEDETRYLLVGWADTLQTNDPLVPRPYDLSAMWSSKVLDEPLCPHRNGPEWIDLWLDQWQIAVQQGIRLFPNLNPHPTPLPSSVCDP